MQGGSYRRTLALPRIIELFPSGGIHLANNTARRRRRRRRRCILPRRRRRGRGTGPEMGNYVGDYPELIWDLDSASLVHSSTYFLVFSMRRRSCAVNAWRCPWMDKQQQIRGRMLLSAMADRGRSGELWMTHLQYKRNAACTVTISPSVAERSGGGDTRRCVQPALLLQRRRRAGIVRDDPDRRERPKGDGDPAQARTGDHQGFAPSIPNRTVATPPSRTSTRRYPA